MADETCVSSPQIKHSGTVSACGLAAGMPLPTTVIVNYLWNTRQMVTWGIVNLQFRSVCPVSVSYNDQCVHEMLAM